MVDATPEIVRRPQVELATLLSQTIGLERATALVAEAATTLGLTATLTKSESLVVLEHIAALPGLVGIAARFAKSRLLLNWRE